jgi:4'-phosphopantetheinyl transferase
MASVRKPLSADDVCVWYRVTGSLGEQAVRNFEATLSADELARCGRFHFNEDRRDFAAAHALLRRTLSLYSALPPREWRFQLNRYGKPATVSDQAVGLTFNLSHTRGLVTCAVACGHDVGIDVEAIRGSETRRDIAARFFSDAEQRYLSACAPHEYALRFVELWTLKEAYIKALGTGLSHPLDSFSFTFGDGGIVFDPGSGVSPRQWQFAVAIPSPGFCLAVAVRRIAVDQRYRLALQNVDVDAEAPSVWARQSLA